MKWLTFFLYNYRWYRRWKGGHWELWYVDHPVCADIWHDVSECTRNTARPTSLCRGTPTCEDWGP